MFPKAALTLLAVGTLSVNALSVPVARSPAPEPECKLPRLFSTISHHTLTFTSSDSRTSRGPDVLLGTRSFEWSVRARTIPDGEPDPHQRTYGPHERVQTRAFPRTRDHPTNAGAPSPPPLPPPAHLTTFPGRSWFLGSTRGPLCLPENMMIFYDCTAM